MKIIKPTILLFLIGVSLSFYSCDTTPTPEVITITPDKTDVNQLEVVTLSTENITFEQGSYSGTIAGQQVMIDTYESKLILQIPEITSGYHILQANIDGHALEVNYHVLLLAPIADPSGYIQNKISEFTYSSTYLTDLHAATANMYGASNNAANEIILNSYVTELQNQISNATPQGIDSLAKFMAANGDIFGPLDDIILEIDSLNLNRAVDFPEVKLLYAKVEAKADIIRVGIMAGASFYMFTKNPWLGGAGLIATAFYVYSINEKLLIQFDKSNLQTGEVNLVSASRSVNEFKSGSQYTFEINSSYRNLNNQDIGSSSAVISSIVGSLNDFSGYWNSLMNWITMIPGSLISLQGTPFHISNISTSQFQTLTPKPSCLSISNISNNNVTAIIDNTGDALKVTFNNSQTTNQNFTFDIAYNNPDVSSHNNSFSGTVFGNLAHNTFGFDDISYVPVTNTMLSLQGDSTGYSILATGSGLECFIKTGSSNFPATLPLPGTYNIYYLNGGVHSLQPNEAIMYFMNYNNSTGGEAISGTVNVSIVSGKYIYKFNGVEIENSTETASGKFSSPL